MEFKDQRTHQIIEMLIEMGKGNFSKKLRVNNRLDDLACISNLLNMISEEWQERLLHYFYNTPDKLHEFSSHLVIELNSEFTICDLTYVTLETLKINTKDLLKTSIFSIVDESGKAALIDAKNAIHLNPLLAKSFPILFTNESHLLKYYQATLQKTHLSKRWFLTLNHLEFKEALPVSENQTEKTRMLYNSLEQKKIQRVHDYIKTRNFSKDSISIKFLCDRFGINSHSLKTKFKEQYQIGVYDFYLNLRLKHAYMLINETQLPLKQISYDVGFKNYSNFQRMFVKKYQTTPSKLRLS